MFPSERYIPRYKSLIKLDASKKEKYKRIERMLKETFVEILRENRDMFEVGHYLGSHNHGGSSADAQDGDVGLC